MRRVHRPALRPGVQAYLDRKAAQVEVATVARAWKAARKTRTMNVVVDTLQSMMGARQRCMYCVDSHGSDIEHYWPKAIYPNRAFSWPNMLLCCTECGRLKGDSFPLTETNQPILVDPSAEDPWEYLDFDPDTGNLTARFDAVRGLPSSRGEATVRILHLDRREGMAEGYRRTYLRVVACVTNALKAAAIDPDELINSLQQIDDHGLLGWCLGPIGVRIQPFSELHRRAPEVWMAYMAAA